MVKRKNEAGFTLIELMMVIVIMAIGLTVGMLYLNNSTVDYKVGSYQERLVQELRGARTEALARNARVDLVINVGDATYQSELNGGQVVSRTGKNNPLKNVKIELTEFNGNRVTFDGRGLVTNISAANGQGIITVVSGTSQRTIRIYAETGFIESVN